MKQAMGWVLITALAVSGCVEVGDPLSGEQIRAAYAGKTVSKTTSDSRYIRDDFSNPSLGDRQIYHGPDFRAYYTKSTTDGYRKRENGRWYVQDNKICYSMLVVKAENNGNTCETANVSLAYSEFADGDVLGLAPRPRTVSSGSGSSGLEGLVAIGAVLGTAVAAGAKILCPNGNCPAPDPSYGASSTYADQQRIAAEKERTAALKSQCKAQKSQCYASCEGLSLDGVIGDLGSDKDRCKRQCHGISC